MFKWLVFCSWLLTFAVGLLGGSACVCWFIMFGLRCLDCVFLLWCLRGGCLFMAVVFVVCCIGVQLVVLLVALLVDALC